MNSELLKKIHIYSLTPPIVVYQYQDISAPWLCDLHILRATLKAIRLSIDVKLVCVISLAPAWQRWQSRRQREFLFECHREKLGHRRRRRHLLVTSIPNSEPSFFCVDTKIVSLIFLFLSLSLYLGMVRNWRKNHFLEGSERCRLIAQSACVAIRRKQIGEYFINQVSLYIPPSIGVRSDILISPSFSPLVAQCSHRPWCFPPHLPQLCTVCYGCLPHLFYSTQRISWARSANTRHPALICLTTCLCANSPASLHRLGGRVRRHAPQDLALSTQYSSKFLWKTPWKQLWSLPQSIYQLNPECAVKIAQ